MGALRRYCWRIGQIVTLADGERCDECGDTQHRPLDDQNACGHFVECRDHGHGCTKRDGHDGAHATERCQP